MIDVENRLAAAPEQTRRFGCLLVNTTIDLLGMRVLARAQRPEEAMTPILRQVDAMPSPPWP